MMSNKGGVGSKKEWISVAREEPPAHFRVLLCVDYGPGLEQQYSVGYRRYDGQGYNSDELRLITGTVTHWQSLPPFPVKEAAEESKAETGHCEDCCHWQKGAAVGFADRGECQVELDLMTADYRDDIERLDGFKWLGTIITPHDFGCVHFKPRREEPDVAPSWIPVSEFRR